MLNVAGKLLLSLSLASIIVGCRSEFGYVKGEGKKPGSSNGPSLTIYPDKSQVSPNEQIRLTATCSNNGSNVVINWEFGDGTQATGQSVTKSFSNPQTYNIKAYCRGSQLLTNTIAINVGFNSGNPNYNPGQYPGKDGVVDIPWQKEPDHQPGATYPGKRY